MFDYKKIDKENIVLMIDDIRHNWRNVPQYVPIWNILQCIPPKLIDMSSNVVIYDGDKYYLIKMSHYVNMTISKNVYNKVIESYFKVVDAEMLNDPKYTQDSLYDHKRDMLYGDFVLFDMSSLKDKMFK